MLPWFAVVIGVLLETVAFAQVPNTPHVTLKLSSDTILAGEPVWGIVTATNTSSTLIVWTPGDYCFMDGQMPITVKVPGAAAGGVERATCAYGVAGNCMMGGNTTKLDPGESATWRFLLEGDFHFEKAGTYPVELTLHPGRVFQSGEKYSVNVAPTAVTETMTLTVLPKDDAALLAREKQLAADVEAKMLAHAALPIANQERAAMFRESQNVRQIRKGLAAQPVVGMEVVFEHWLELPNDFENDAIQGLKHLNTSASRADLAKIAKTPTATLKNPRCMHWVIWATRRMCR